MNKKVNQKRKKGAKQTTKTKKKLLRDRGLKSSNQ